MPDDPPPAASSPSVARQLGERLGTLTAQLASLRADFVDGKASAELQAATARAAAELAAARAEAAAELDAWDGRFGLRAATRAQLLLLAKERGVRGASRLSKRELADVLEANMAADEEDARVLELEADTSRSREER